jgi:uncharacterized protein
MTEASEPAVPPARHAPGTPCWVSLMARGTAATEHFYGELFGWEFRPGPQQLGPYVRALLDGHEVAGIGRLPADRRLPVAWTPYLASDDVDLTAERVRMCGGTVGVGPLDAEDAGRLLIGSDPAGAVFGVWQAAAHAGTSLTGVPGTPAWHELLTYEPAGVVKFYESLFGYTQDPWTPDPGAADPAPDPDLRDAPDATGGGRVVLRIDGRPVAEVRGGRRDLVRARGPHWRTSFEVADPDEAAARVTGLGGTVLVAPHDTPRGRGATVTDPEGALFALIRSNR